MQQLLDTPVGLLTLTKHQTAQTFLRSQLIDIMTLCNDEHPVIECTSPISKLLHRGELQTVSLTQTLLQETCRSPQGLYQHPVWVQHTLTRSPGCKCFHWLITSSCPRSTVTLELLI